MVKVQPKYIAYMMMAIIPISGLGIDIFTPALPVMKDVFQASLLHVRSLITVYIVGYGLSQLISGPQSDRYGRRTLFLIGLAVFFFFSLLIPNTHVFNLFLLFRFLQGFGIGLANTCTRAVIVDIFEGKAYAKYSGCLVVFWALGPVVAPIIGGHLLTSFGWQACFYTLALYSGIMLFLVSFFYSETKVNLVAKDSVILVNNMARVITHRPFLTSLLLLGLAYSTLTVFYVTGPFIIQHVLHHSPIFFGHCSGLVSLAWLLGMICTGSSKSAVDTVPFSYFLLFMLGCTLLALLLFNQLQFVYLYMGFLVLYTMSSATLFKLALNFKNNVVMAFFKDISGTVSSIVGAGCWGIGAAFTFGISFISFTNLEHILWLYLVLVAFIFFVHRFMLPKESALKR